MKPVYMLLTVIGLSVLLAFPARAGTETVHGLWVWDFYEALSTPEQRERLLNVAGNNGINLLFIGTNQTLPRHPSDYEALIRNAHQAGIRVFALAGKSDWALEQNHRHVLAHVQQVMDYNLNYPSAPFDGIQLDIEPYTLPDFSANTERISRQLLQVLKASSELAAESNAGLELNAAIPFWYASGEKPVVLDYGGERKPLSHHVLDLVDTVSIMAYRNNAQAQIQLSRAEIEYAGQTGKKVYVGAETKPPEGNSIPERITYHHTSLPYMNEQLDMIRSHYANHAGFGGTAIHEYASFQIMLHKQHRLEEKFDYLKSKGILNGDANSDAGYRRPASRAEIAAIAARMSGYSEGHLAEPLTPGFRDVPLTAWYYGWVESAREAGVMNGKEDGMFDPEANITLEEFVIVLSKVCGLSESDNPAAEQGASDWARGWIQAAVDSGIIKARKDYTTLLRRDEMIHLLYEVYMLQQ